MWLRLPKAELGRSRAWSRLLQEEQPKPYFESLARFLENESAQGHSVYPAAERVFQALDDTPFESVRVVILGQDPYHGPGQALGRSFAVPRDLQPKPPSLVNIFKEVESDLGCRLDRSLSELTGWTRQGVLLLNTVLTVRAQTPLSHRKRGWETFTQRILDDLIQRPEPAVFMLWGSQAQSLAKTRAEQLRNSPHLVLEAPHPSPLSAHRGFLGCRHFSKANAFLQQPVDWTRLD